MKRVLGLFVIISMIGILFAGCAKNQVDTKDNNSTTDHIIVTEWISSDSESTHSGNIEELVGDLASPKFYCVEDFETFLRTGSTDLSSYSKEAPPYALANAPEYLAYLGDMHFSVVEAFALNDTFMNQLEYIRMDITGIEYMFKTGVCINYRYRKGMVAEEDASVMVPSSSLKFVSFEEAQITPLQQGEKMAHYIGDSVVTYMGSYNQEKKFSSMCMEMLVCGFDISVCIETEVWSNDKNKIVKLYNGSIESLLSDPIHAEIAPFFVEDANRTVAFSAMVKNIVTQSSGIK